MLGKPQSTPSDGVLIDVLGSRWLNIHTEERERDGMAPQRHLL
jgi:hypothetical protein